MTEPIITIYLKNGLTLSIYDESIKIAGDRWQVNLIVRIQIVTNQIQFSRLVFEKRPEVIQTIGEQISYEKKLIRNFVANNEKEEIISGLCASFLNNTKSYLSHQQFAERFALKCYADSLEKRKWVNS
jgi:hypothetical protein